MSWWRIDKHIVSAFEKITDSSRNEPALGQSESSLETASIKPNKSLPVPDGKRLTVKSGSLVCERNGRTIKTISPSRSLGEHNSIKNTNNENIVVINNTNQVVYYEIT